MTRNIIAIAAVAVTLAACGKFAIKPTIDRCTPPQQWHTDRCNDRDGQQTIQQPERDPPAEKAPSPPK